MKWYRKRWVWFLMVISVFCVAAGVFLYNNIDLFFSLASSKQFSLHTPGRENHALYGVADRKKERFDIGFAPSNAVFKWILLTPIVLSPYGRDDLRVRISLRIGAVDSEVFRRILNHRNDIRTVALKALEGLPLSLCTASNVRSRILEKIGFIIEREMIADIVIDTIIVGNN